MNLEPYTIAISTEWCLAWGLALLLITGAAGCLLADWLRDLDDQHAHDGTEQGGTNAQQRTE